MITLYRLKPQFQALLRPLSGALDRAGVSASQVTVCACMGSVTLGAWLALYGEHTQWFLLLPVWCFLRMALNAIDGIMAREHAQSSPLGAYLNELGDVISDAALILPFALLAGAHAGLVVVVALLSCLTELAGVIGVLIHAGRRHDGPLGKSDRAFALGVLGLLLGLGVPPGNWLTAVFAAIALLLVVTVRNRIVSGILSTERASHETPGG